MLVMENCNSISLVDGEKIFIHMKPLFYCLFRSARRFNIGAMRVVQTCVLSVCVVLSDIGSNN